jgi:ribosomal protein S18 acetylase RimI-like enzyme
MSTVHIRPATPDDLNLLMSTWLKGYRHGSPWARRLVDAVFYGNHHDIVTRIIQRSRCLVACDPGDQTFIAGYIVWEPAGPKPAVVHWCYVKKSLRRAGVAKALLTATGLPLDLTGCEVSHPTSMYFHGHDTPGLEDVLKATVNPYRWSN